jgi:hypothetical protein
MTNQSKFKWARLGGFLLAAAAGLLSGCSQGPDAPLNQLQHTLAVSYQVTIATPNGVSPTAPVLICPNRPTAISSPWSIEPVLNNSPCQIMTNIKNFSPKNLLTL